MRFLGCLLLAFGIGLAAAPAAATSALGDAPQAASARAGDQAIAAAKKKAPPKKKRRTPPPDRRKEAPAQRVDPLMVSAAAAGGAAGGACVGAGTVVTAAIIGLGVFGAPTVPVMITAAVIGIGVAVATPFMAALGGGAAVLLADPRSKPEEWSSLLQCAASGYCMGLSLIGGTLLGATGCGLPVCGGGQTPDKIPGPDRAAEWTAGSAIAGLIGGTVLGGLLGWAMAPDPNDPFIPIGLGAGGGAVLGAGVVAGAGAAIATAVRR
ncbi:MAG: hypothetical protein IT383_06745 [Deltaproteobacteria bacterium]|nr:hypothetical protein [Deltaproteobacteria bacterium]